MRMQFGVRRVAARVGGVDALTVVVTLPVHFKNPLNQYTGVMMLKPLVMDFPPIFLQASILTLPALYHEYPYMRDYVDGLMILNIHQETCT